jgi:hypothetical protein
MARDDPEHPSNDGERRFDDAFVAGASYREPSARERGEQAEAAARAEKQAREAAQREQRRASRREKFGRSRIRKLVPLLILIAIALALTRLGADRPAPLPGAPVGKASNESFSSTVLV